MNPPQDGILILDAETGKIIDVNPFLCELLDYSKEKFVDKELWQIGFFKDIAANKEKFLELQQKGYVRYEDLPLKTANGRMINVEFVSYLYLVNNHKVIQCNIRDITEHKEEQKKVKFQSDLLYNVGQAVIATDLQGNVIYWNNEAEKIYGWTSDEAMGQSIVDLTPAQQTKGQAIEIMKELSKGNTWSGEFFVKRKDGTSFQALVTDAPITDTDGKLIGIIGISSDITERKQAEEELLKLSRAVEQSPVSIIITDTEGDIEYINPKVTEITGYQFAEVIGKKPRIFSSGEKPKSEYKELWATITSGKEWRGEFHNKKKNGELYWEAASISPIINEKGIISDII
ncbi:MAG: PAS domain S-box protein [Melioribacteraceae bacterium]|nr:PAS domain S-box protein [Melioribacteraceae bacterium]